MVRNLLLVASAISVVRDALLQHKLMTPNSQYQSVTISSPLLLTARELTAWSTDLPIQDRVAIFHRGLLRHEQTQKP